MGVCCVMLSKVVTLLEGFPTHCALIWLLTCMNSLMNSNRGAMRKGFLTFITFKNGLSCPDFLVFSYLGIFREGFLL